MRLAPGPGPLFWLAVLGGCATADPALDDPDIDPGGSGEIPEEPGGEPGDCPLSGIDRPLEAVFSAGHFPGDSVADEVIALIRGAEPGSTIRVSTYSLDDEAVAAELIDAAEREVDVAVIVDGINRVESPAGSGAFAPNPTVAALLDALGPSKVTICSDDEAPGGLTGGCFGEGSNHANFVLLSSLCDGSQSVVVQLSHNLDPGEDLDYDALISRDDADLYAGYLALWEDQNAQVPQLDYYRTVEGRSTRAFMFPRISEGDTGRHPRSDTVYNVLGEIDCTGGTRIRAAMTNWTSGRDYLATRLRALADSGCDVGLLVADRTAIADMLSAKFSAGELRFVPGLRHRYLIIDGIYGGAPRRLVWTGSHHWVYSALRTSEDVLLRVDDIGVFELYLENWRMLWQAGQ